MAQTTVTQFATPGFVGYLAEQRASDVLKAGPLLQNENIPFATGLVLDPTADYAVMLPSSANQTLAGVSYNAFTLMTPLQNNPSFPAFHQNESVTYAARCAIWVAPEQDVAIGDPVYCRFTDGGALLSAGRFRVDDGSTNPVIRLTFTGTPASETVVINGNTVSDATGDLATFAGLIAAQPGVASAVLASSHIDITGSNTNLTVTGQAVTGVGASVSKSTQTAAVAPIAFLVPNARWLTNASGNPDLLATVDACKLEINTP